MAEQQTPQTPEAGQRLRGGTEGGELSRAMDPASADEGTPGVASASGGVHIEQPSRYSPRTDLPARVNPDGRLMGGKTPEAILGYIAGVEFPAKKDAIVRAAYRNSAPEDVLGALTILPATEYADADSLIRDYPGLPDEADLARSEGDQSVGRLQR